MTRMVALVLEKSTHLRSDSVQHGSATKAVQISYFVFRGCGPIGVADIKHVEVS